MIGRLAIVAAAACGLLPQVHASVTIGIIPEGSRSLYQPEILTIDINNDGTPDLRFEPAGSGTSSFTTRVYPLNGAQILRDTIPANQGLANLLPYTFADGSITEIGASVSVSYPDSPWLAPSTNFAWYDAGSLYLAFGYVDGGSITGGNFLNQPHGLMAFSFLENGERHYGWFDVGVQYYDLLLLHSYGYETEANTPIFIGAPEPGRAVLLLLGCLFIFCRRRRALGSG